MRKENLPKMGYSWAPRRTNLLGSFVFTFYPPVYPPATWCAWICRVGRVWITRSPLVHPSTYSSAETYVPDTPLRAGVTQLHMTDAGHDLKIHKTSRRKQKILGDLEFGRDFLNKTWKEKNTWAIKAKKKKIKILDVIKIKWFCFTKGSVKKDWKSCNKKIACCSWHFRTWF